MPVICVYYCSTRTESFQNDSKELMRASLISNPTRVAPALSNHRPYFLAELLPYSLCQINPVGCVSLLL